MRAGLLVAVLLAGAIGCVSSQMTYIGSVVELVPVNFDSGQYPRELEQLHEETIQRLGPGQEDEAHVLAVKIFNLRRYEHAISLVANSTDIIVFNEDGITGWPLGYDEGRDGALPWLEEIPAVGSVPCEDESLEVDECPSVYYGSLFAKRYGLTVVIDIGEVEWCDNDDLARDCPSDGRWQFNTQLVFSSDGSILARHRKLHLFLADADIFNYPAPALDHFESSFGVTFGMLVCFDVWFRYPGFAMADGDLGIENFILSSWWENNGTLPLVSAVNMQQAFAREAEANLLGCSVGVSFFNSGSGVYNGPGQQQNFVYNVDFPSLDMHIISMELPASPRSQQITEPLLSTISVSQEDHLQFIGADEPSFTSLYPSGTLPAFRSRLISMPEGAAVTELRVVAGDSFDGLVLTNGLLTCSFSFSSRNGTSGSFAIMAYQGPYFDNMLYADVCALFKCNDEYGCSALTLDAGDIVFEDVAITASLNDRQPAYAIGSGPDGQLFDMSALETHQVDGGVQLRTNPSFSSPVVNVVLYAEQAGRISP